MTQLTAYGVVKLQCGVEGGVCCAIHLSGEERSLRCYDIGVGYHKAVVALRERGFVECHEEPRVLKRDRAYARDVLNVRYPDFAYLRENGLRGYLQYEGGYPISPDAYGKGYCYLRLFREKIRSRIARLLGPCPPVVNVLPFLAASGVKSAKVGLRVVSQSMVHVEVTTECVQVKEVVSELLGLRALMPDLCVGASWDKTVDGRLLEMERVVFALQSVVLSGEGEGSRGLSDKVSVAVGPESVESRAWDRVLCDRHYCYVCGFVVKTDGHEQRCRLPTVRHRRAELIGDALHALDVKTAVVISGCPDNQLTVVANRYISARGQRTYLESQNVVDADQTISDHRVATRFELQYKGAFRRAYIRWLSQSLKCEFGLSEEVVGLVEGYRLDDVVGSMSEDGV